jgi:hypothetical protein
MCSENDLRLTCFDQEADGVALAIAERQPEVRVASLLHEKRTIKSAPDGQITGVRSDVVKAADVLIPYVLRTSRLDKAGRL